MQEIVSDRPHRVTEASHARYTWRYTIHKGLRTEVTHATPNKIASAKWVETFKAEKR